MGRRKAPTIKDIAAEAGVSKSAVSRALLGQGEVSPHTRQRVEDAARTLGYVANAMAAGLRSRTNTIGVVLRDISRPYYGALFAAMQEQAEQRGYRLVTATSAGELDVANAIGVVRSLMSLQVDGVILASAQLDSEQILPVLERIPVVVAGRMELGSNVPGVYCDDVDGGTSLADVVFRSGHQRVAVGIVERSYSLSQHVRGEAMSGYLSKKGVDVVEIPLPDDRHMEEALSVVLADPGITALMCPTDAAVLAVLEELQRRESSGNTLSLTGYDGVGPLASPYLGFTTYRQPVEEIGARAIDLMVDAIQRPDDDDVPHVALRGEVVRGRTVAQASVNA
ncbi:MAG: LacI family transcription regulator [Microbacterium sp.]|nr:LacI family transcription regulator [Microbacterium sp.]